MLRAPAAETDEQHVHGAVADQVAAEILRHLVAEQAMLHPADDEQVGGGDEYPVPARRT